jgi:hypothetical protein
MSPESNIARKTAFRRATASAGRLNGSNTEGACGSPARSAACTRFSSWDEREKYVCAAASMPYAWFPKYTWFRYVSRILSFDHEESSLSARQASFALRVKDFSFPM